MSMAGTTTNVELSTLPVASTFPPEVAAETLTISGVPVVYSPVTLPGYTNIEPAEIFTTFVEQVNGQATTQAGWWLIGPHGRIDPPTNKPWRVGPGNFGCIAGPLLCDAPCGDVDVGGGWFIHIFSNKCTPGITGPPGWPGSPIVFGSGGPDDDPPPYDDTPEGPGNEEPDDCDEDGVRCSMSTTTATQSSTPSQTSSSVISMIPYLLIAAVGADQRIIEQEIQDANSESSSIYEPDVGDTEYSGGTWIDVALSPLQASSMASRGDINLVMPCANATFFSADPNPTTVSAATTVTLITLTADPSSVAYTSKNRRFVEDQRRRAPRARSMRRREIGRDLVSTVQDLSKRDPGTLLVRQEGSPKDLSVLAWAPGVPSVAEVDYIMRQTKGEFSWVYVVDEGFDDNHWDFQDNWEGIDGFGKNNIDPDWIWAPGMAHAKQDPTGHGTCMASKVCGKKSGVAKQAVVIPVVFSSNYQSAIAVVQQVSIDIRSRRDRATNKQALPGKTVVSISWGFPPTNSDYVTQFKDALQAIMDLGVIVVVSAGNSRKLRGFVSQYYPEALALSDGFPLIRVGAVDASGLIADFSQEGDVYTEGIAAKCAMAGFSFFEEDVDGTSGATAAFAGLVAYMMGLETVPFSFGSDYTQYQRIVKDYFVTGPGSYVRPGGNARVAWNGLDGSAQTVCPLSLRKRQEQPENICQSSSTSFSVVPTQTASLIESTSASPSVIPTQSASWINEITVTIYYSVVEPCTGTLSECELTYYAYVLYGSLPLQECGGALGQGSGSVQFQLYTLTGSAENFIYSTSSTNGGTITGDSLGSPITCSNSSSEAVAWSCPLTKRSVYPDPPSTHILKFYEWATCDWNLS